MKVIAANIFFLSNQVKKSYHILVKSLKPFLCEILILLRDKMVTVSGHKTLPFSAKMERHDVTGFERLETVSMQSLSRFVEMRLCLEYCIYCCWLLKSHLFHLLDLLLK